MRLRTYWRPWASTSPGLLIYDALRACASDGDLSQHELSAVKATAHKLGISEKDVDTLRGIVEEERALRQRKIEAVFPQGTPYKTQAAG